MKTMQQFATFDEIVDNTFVDEKNAIEGFINSTKLDKVQNDDVANRAAKFVSAIKSAKRNIIESILQEYSLSNDEGVALMCLSEALLRIPDDKTAIELIEDSISNKNWVSHLGRNKGLFVNVSTWGLVLTGKVVGLNKLDNLFGKISKKLSSKMILAAVKKAIKIISREYILGENLDEAIKNSTKSDQSGYKFSFDMLGESARTMEQAEDFFQQYVYAIKALGNAAGSADLNANHNLSVKLTALHPKVNIRYINQLEKDLYPKLEKLVELCMENNISLTFDAEESYRLDAYIAIITKLITADKFKDFHGIGFVVQAYGLRADKFLDYIVDLARTYSKKILVRLVKGAYWDTEIKYAQERGHEGYPVFTRKEYTDVSYMACAQKLLNNVDVIYPQFATHNAYTISYIMQIAGDHRDFEFQRLQGMGKSLHDEVLKCGYRSRIYAPVGNYEKLLAYLMRRLLENGANNSFVNLVVDESISVEHLLENPVSKAEKSLEGARALPSPREIYSGLRDNSVGYDIGYQKSFTEITNNLDFAKRYDARPHINGEWISPAKKDEVLSPIDTTDVVGYRYSLSADELDGVVDNAYFGYLNWSNVPVIERAKIIREFGKLLDIHKYEFYGLLIREAGKNIDDAIAEVREAIDFAEYYATYAERLMGQGIKLPSYTGESNTLSWHSKGVFVCISPWNFPLAIFCGQIAAALVTGNAVISKPAENTCIIASYAIKLLLEAGVHKDAISLTISSGSNISKKVISHPRVSGVCFTGSTGVARNINKTLADREGAIGTLIAETGGQNAMIVDSSALLEQAVDNIVISAFGSAGQRCSALRVVYVQDDIYEELEHLLIGAMNMLEIGDTKDMSYDIGPVISAVSKAELLDHVNKISKKSGCRVLAKHKQHNDKSLNNGTFLVPHIISVGSIVDIEKENFGPILHICKFKAGDIDKVISDINATNYGLTFGVQSRIQSKIDKIVNMIHCGNSYVNRTMIGAQVGAHPFGGENDSGTGFKAGGPHYLYKFMNERVVTINTTAIGGNLELLSSLDE